MDIKAIICRLTAPDCRLGLCVCLGSIGGEGLMCGIESLQAAGLAVMAMSFWQGARIIYDRRPQDGECVSDNENLELLGVALKNSEAVQAECLAIGRKYLNGIGTVRDFKQAFDTFYKGAVLGSPACATEVGCFYEQGRYKPQNLFLARYWFERGAMGGDALAAYHLACFYAEHQAKGYKGRLAYFLGIACQAGLADARRLQTRLLAKGIPALAEKVLTSANGAIPPSALYDYAHREELRRYIYKGGTCSPAVIKVALGELGFEPDDFKDYEFTEASLRPAYLRRMHELHPDANGGDDSHASEMDRLRRAYRLLLKLGT